MRVQGRINFMRRTEEQMRISKKSSMINSVNQQTPKMNNGERKEHSTYFSQEKSQQNYKIQQTHLNNNPKCKYH
jgi:hypothetical protein